MTPFDVKWLLILPKPLRINNPAAQLSPDCCYFVDLNQQHKIAAAALQPTKADWMLYGKWELAESQSKQETSENVQNLA